MVIELSRSTQSPDQLHISTLHVDRQISKSNGAAWVDDGRELTHARQVIRSEIERMLEFLGEGLSDAASTGSGSSMDDRAEVRATTRATSRADLADALDQWAFCSITSSPGARTFYDRRRAAGDSHHKALRALANRWVGILHGCLDHQTRYDENTAWGHRIDADLRKIAQAA
jgi:hypothetical protein